MTRRRARRRAAVRAGQPVEAKPASDRYPLLRAAARCLSPPLALVMAADLLWSPAELSLDAGRRLEVSAQSVKTRRTRERAVFIGAADEVVEVTCDKIFHLCDALRTGPKHALTVWVTEPGLFFGTWLIAANEGATPLVPLHEQNRLYHRTKTIGFGMTLACAALAAFCWRTRLTALVKRRTCVVTIDR